MACQTMSCGPDSTRSRHLVYDQAEKYAIDNVTGEVNDAYRCMQVGRQSSDN